LDEEDEMETLLKVLLLWLLKRARPPKMRIRQFVARRVVTFDDKFLFWRFEPFWHDEWVRLYDGKHINRPPWWRPFNVLLHQWIPEPGTKEDYHDHPRWSITLCLRGKLIEHTPWGDKVLRPGSIVLRSRKYIHAFSVPEGYSGKTWTVFIVGRRNYRQNTYVIAAQ
jgi:hypothetical protein